MKALAREVTKPKVVSSPLSNGIFSLKKKEKIAPGGLFTEGA